MTTNRFHPEAPLSVLTPQLKDLKALTERMNRDTTELREQMHRDFAALGERIARLEGFMEGIREAIAGKAA